LSLGDSEEKLSEGEEKELESFILEDEDTELALGSEDSDELQLEDDLENNSSTQEKVAENSNDELSLEDDLTLENEEEDLSDRAIASLKNTASGNQNISLTEEIDEYLVERGDTLMLISFKLYGDYAHWRKLYQLNEKVIPASFDLSSLSSIKYYRPSSKFVNPEGTPYLIKFGDSLSRISGKVYGQWQKWPLIYKNNSHQIKDPNLIFAGFTLYYPDLNQISLD
jgi:nucleoid-associated protein YgaU